MDASRTLLNNYYFNPKRYDLAKVGRYKINKKFGRDAELSDSVLSVEDIVATIEYIVRLHAGETVADSPRGEIRTRLTTLITSVTVVCVRLANSSRTRSARVCLGWSASFVSG